MELFFFIDLFWDPHNKNLCKNGSFRGQLFFPLPITLMHLMLHKKNLKKNQTQFGLHGLSLTAVPQALLSIFANRMVVTYIFLWIHLANHELTLRNRWAFARFEMLYLLLTHMFLQFACGFSLQFPCGFSLQLISPQDLQVYLMALFPMTRLHSGWHSTVKSYSIIIGLASLRIFQVLSGLNNFFLSLNCQLNP